MAQVRMYVQRGCPHCEAAKQFVQSKGVGVEAIEIGFDPILQAGIRLYTGGGNFSVPLTISYLTGEIVLGNDPIALQRVVDSLGVVAVTSNASAS
jgi:glutaredoxin